MGKASQWFRGILGMKKQDSCSPAPTAPKPPKEKRRWSFVKSHREKDDQRQYHTTKQHSYETTSTAATGRRNSCGLMIPVHQEFGAVDPNKHAIAVAAATAAVAEAAQAAAQAAAAVVRLTSSGRCASNTSAYGGGSQLIGARKDQWAAVKIQAAFRGCLARRALRALKGLVKLQALVRGHIERKRTAEWLQRMQALLRAKARVRASRAGQISESLHLSSKSSHLQYHIGPATPEKTEHVIRRKSTTKYDQPPTLKRNGSKLNSRLVGDQDKALLGRNRSDSQSDEQSCDRRGCSMRTGTMDDEKTDKILQIDMGKSHFTTKRNSLFHSSHNVMASDQHSHSFTISKDSTAHQTVSSPSSFEVQSLSPLKFSLQETDQDSSFHTANNSPQVNSASSRGGGSTRSPFTRTKRTDVSRSCLSGYLDHPNYMAYTESSRGKARSLSAPKQRPQYERSSSTKRHYVHHAFGESRLMSAPKDPNSHADFASKAHPGSGRLDKLGMAMGHKY
ncbi:uncharacterized protein LOC121237561 [Juglans microcarpa x Juglans regia]|uniref:uncharacterized protein LOC121237561 n=1 Tax=Juglans microcarpa x Juglans regia TaxID=2249226 RepID=UPI001B7DB323|nr:uncharacterized protein LOC121237561 [Juglans microcarpa x Juglans regia]